LALASLRQKYKTKRVYYLCTKIIQDLMKGNQLHPRQISIESYDYPLPESRIAQFPLEARDSSKLLVCKQSNVSEDVFSNLTSHLPQGSLVIFNETRVIHARLQFRKETGSAIEIFCLEPLAPFRDHNLALQQKGHAEWLCLVGGSKRWKGGLLNLYAGQTDKKLKIVAERMEKLDGGTSTIRFRWEPAELTFAEVLEFAGNIPLPPYITRKPVERDEVTYQTVYARHEGSVAAPTAGLHFSDEVLTSLETKNINLLKFVLHVGAGTFKPVSSVELADHEMHAEEVNLSLESLEKLRESLDKPIIAVGTTTVRLLESLYWHGVKVIKNISDPARLEVQQWDPYDELASTGISREAALDAMIRGCRQAGITSLKGKTSLLIAPGYRFRFPDILITNFHQPRSTLLLLIAAFIGEEWRKAYQYALDNEFRFLSYGDSCLFFRS
jgi:S-adenosylmethionine:tRNA ribosyltransferase-isomerase